MSAIIIFLDAERWLAEAIESVRAQTSDDWELLLVDDGSRDASSAVAQAAAAHDRDRVRYFQHPGHRNRGMSATRNLGLHHARGQAVAFCDADDVWLPDKLARQHAPPRRASRGGHGGERHAVLVLLDRRRAGSSS